MKIPFLSLEKTNYTIKEEVFNAFQTVFETQHYILGQKLLDFEKNYADFSQTKFCIGVGNGYDALMLALKALEIEEGDEVIVPSNTYIATVLAVSSLRAKPIFVEPSENTFNIQSEKIQEKISRYTKAIIPVHLYGQACEMDKIISLAKANSLFVVEDNAQAQGATFLKKPTGSFGNLNATSFYPGKNLGAFGDGGALTTHDAALARKVRILRNYGSEMKYENEVMGVNSRLDEMQASFLNVKLKYLKTWNNERNKIAISYIQMLYGVGDLILPFTAQNATHVYHQFVIRTKYRDQLQLFLANQGISTLIHYPIPPHLQKAYSHLGFKKGDFPISEELANTCLSLPLYIGLEVDQLTYIADAIKKFYKSIL